MEKGKSKKIRRLITAVLAGAMLLGTAVPAFAASIGDNSRVVRVGYYPVVGYQENNDGIYGGFSYDYYMQIQKYTGWKYEFVEAGYADCVKMLISGDIDIIGGIAKNPEREQTMLIPDFSVSNAQSKLYATEDAPLYYESYDLFDGCSVAVMSGALTDELDGYCRDHNFSLEKVEYPTTAEMEQALMDGEVDLLYTSSLNKGLNTKIVARLKKTPLYYGVNINEPEIAEELEFALQKIVDNNPDFYAQMTEKYMVSGANAAATFTKEELDYIKSCGSVNVILNENWAPISWYDSDSGEFKGICPDVLDKISEYSGIDFKYYSETDFDAAAADNPEMIENVIAVLADDSAWADSRSVMITNHIADSSVVLVTKRNGSKTIENMKIALPKDFYISWCLERVLDNNQIDYYDTVEQCLDAINSGKADATYVNQLVATYFLSELEYSDLYATADSGYDENIAFAVNKTADNPLLGILDKSLLYIGSDELCAIVMQNSTAEQKVTLSGLMRSEPIAFAGIAAAFVTTVCIMAFALYSTHTRRRRMAGELEKEIETARARTEFFMMISHELRTPLNAVVGYLSLAEEECVKGGKPAEYIRRSKSAANQLEAISNDMLDYTKISADTVSLASEVMDIKDVVRAVNQEMALAAESKGLEFNFAVDNINHEHVVGDKLRVMQILQNLVSNAVKFTDKDGRVDVLVSQQENKDSVVLHFSVRDTGRGMSEEFLQRICTPFEQSDSAYSRTHGGLGLGLYLTKYYLNAMGGTMEVESTLGEGSRFSISLPLKWAEKGEGDNEEHDFSRLRAIIAGANDEENQRLRLLLGRLKIKSDIVASGEMAVRRVLSRSGGEYAYGLCIIDESVIGEDMSAAKEIAEIPDAPHIFAVMSVGAVSLDAENGQNKWQVLQKPIFQSVLFDAIVNNLGKYKVEQELSLFQADFSKYKALVVEDNAVNADILCRVLKRAGMPAAVCENGLAAVETFEASPRGSFDIILMDIQMPIMDGYTATRRIRESKNPDGAVIPIVAVSANAFPEDVAHSLECGMNAHISKPISSRKLFKLFEELLNK